MAKLNFEELTDIGESLLKKGDSKFLTKKQITNETVIRLMEPTPAMNSKYFLAVFGYWIAGKKYYTSEWETGVDPLKEEIEEAKSLKDAEIDALLKNWNTFSRVNDFITPLLHLDVLWKGKHLVKCDVIDGMVKFGEFNKPLIIAINQIVVHRSYQNSDLGVCDRFTGRNITLSKSGTGTETRYSAIAEPDEMEMDSSWYEDSPCPVEWIKGVVATDEEVIAAFRNYIYGEPLTKVATSKSAHSALPKSATSSSKHAPQTTKKSSFKDVMEDDSDE